MDSAQLVNSFEELGFLINSHFEQARREFPELKERDERIIKLIWFNSADHSIPMAELIRELHVTPAAITQMVHTFETLGLLQKYKSQDDKRANTIVVHPDIIESIEEKRNNMAQHILRYYATLNPDHQKALDEILPSLIAYLQDNCIFYGPENQD